MTRRTSWTVSAVVAALVAVFLVWVATFRFSAPLVSPAPPVPDYSLQAGIAVAGFVAVLLCFVVTGINAAKPERRRLRATIVGCLVMVGTGVFTAILAFTIPAMNR
ncbi:hypothetical protein AB0301_14660 [Microbacterium profundi]|uniref:Uncharacterized protein n=1 Tax=Microbacterium profundi TaxID=450380 RepID=A0ABV3LK70_9MICO